MIALLKKEMYFMKNQFLILVGIFTLFGFMFSFLGMIQVLPSVLGGIGMSVCINNYSYDETAKFQNYALSMPWGAKAIVLSRYLASFAMTGLGVAFGLIIAMAYGTIFHKPVNMEFVLGNVVGGLFGIIVITLVIIPAVFKGGVSKLVSSAIIGLLLVGGVTLLLAILSELLTLYMPEMQANMISIGLGAFIACGGFYLSYSTSLKILKMQ